MQVRQHLEIAKQTAFYIAQVKYTDSSGRDSALYEVTAFTQGFGLMPCLGSAEHSSCFSTRSPSPSPSRSPRQLAVGYAAGGSFASPFTSPARVGQIRLALWRQTGQPPQEVREPLDDA